MGTEIAMFILTAFRPSSQRNTRGRMCFRCSTRKIRKTGPTSPGGGGVVISAGHGAPAGEDTGALAEYNATAGTPGGPAGTFITGIPGGNSRPGTARQRRGNGRRHKDLSGTDARHFRTDGKAQRDHRGPQPGDADPAAVLSGHHPQLGKHLRKLAGLRRTDGGPEPEHRRTQHHLRDTAQEHLLAA